MNSNNIALNSPYNSEENIQKSDIQISNKDEELTADLSA